MRISSLTFLSFVWLIKTFKILLPTKNVNEVSCKQKLIIRNRTRELCKMNSIDRVTNYNLNLIVPILLTFLLSFSVVISSNNNPLKIHDSIQQKRYNKLLIENRPKQDTEKVILNFSKLSLTDAEKTLLVKDLSFALPPKQVSYSDYLINFELFYRSIDILKNLSGDNLDFIKTRIKGFNVFL